MAEEQREIDFSLVLSGWAMSHGFKRKLLDAVDNASDQDRMTWITSDGKRIAAIVPVDVAEHAESWRDVGPTTGGVTLQLSEQLARDLGYTGPWPPAELPERKLTLLQVAETLGVSRESVISWSAKGYIAFTRTPGGHRRYAQSEVERVRREHKPGSRWPKP